MVIITKFGRLNIASRLLEADKRSFHLGYAEGNVGMSVSLPRIRRRFIIRETRFLDDSDWSNWLRCFTEEATVLVCRVGTTMTRSRSPRADLVDHYPRQERF